MLGENNGNTIAIKSHLFLQTEYSWLKWCFEIGTTSTSISGNVLTLIYLMYIGHEMWIADDGDG